MCNKILLGNTLQVGCAHLAHPRRCWRRHTGAAGRSGGAGQAAGLQRNVVTVRLWRAFSEQLWLLFVRYRWLPSYSGLSWALWLLRKTTAGLPESLALQGCAGLSIPRLAIFSACSVAVSGLVGSALSGHRAELAVRFCRALCFAGMRRDK